MHKLKFKIIWSHKFKIGDKLLDLLSPEHRALLPVIICINHDFGLTLTYVLTARSNLV